MRIIKITICGFIFLILNSTAFAAINKECGYEIDAAKKQLILFINGIKNDKTEACASSDLLANKLSININYDYFYNKKDPGFADIDELRVQSSVSNKAMSESLISKFKLITLGLENSQKLDYYYKLGKAYLSTVKDDLFGSRVKTAKELVTYLKNKLKDPEASIIVVAHSQGNFFIESAYATLIEDGYADYASRIRVVGAAPVAGTTPNSKYFSHSKDKAVFVAHAGNYPLTGYVYEPLPGNHNLCVMPCTASDSTDYTKLVAATKDAKGTSYQALHAFDHVYMNDKIGSVETKKSLPSMVKMAVERMIYELNYKSLSTWNSSGANVCLPTTSLRDTQTNIIYAKYSSCDSDTAKNHNPYQSAMLGKDSVNRDNVAGDVDGAGSASLVKVCNNGSVASRDNLDCKPNATHGVFASNWSCTLDKTTGLMWEDRPHKSPNFNKADYPYDENFYLHYDLNQTFPTDTEYRLSTSYVKYVNLNKLCGYSDWRLPAAQEMEDLLPVIWNEKNILNIIDII